MKPYGLVEWYRRLGQVSGSPEVKTLAEAEAGYARMDQSRLTGSQRITTGITPSIASHSIRTTEAE